MIDRRELLVTAANLGLLPNVVEKDYVLGWLLAGYLQPSGSRGQMGIQGRNVSQEVLLRNIPLFRGPRLHADR